MHISVFVFVFDNPQHIGNGKLENGMVLGTLG